MESLVDEKVDAFWRGVDSEASKSGQIIVTFSEKKQKKTTWFQVYAGEVHLSSSPVHPPAPHRRSTGGGPMGTMVPYGFRSSVHGLRFPRRIISAEIRQPKSDQGTHYRALEGV